MSIKLNPVKSSNVKATGYDPVAKTLAVQFNSGGVYHYAGVEQKDFDALSKAESIGSHIGKHIRPKFKGELQKASA
jgi:hypothetical protein